MQFVIEQKDPGITVISVTGAMTLGPELPVLEGRLAEMSQDSKNKVVLDLTKVEYADSAGLGVIVTSYGLINEAGGRLRLAGAGEQIRRLFRITEVDTLLVFDDTLEAACRALGTK
jgi:anti-sigma B factor antagonist